MTSQPLVSVVIVTRNRREKMLRLLKSVLASNYPSEKIETIVIDNVSTDGTVEAIAQQFPEVKILPQEENLYSAGGRNVGAKAANGEYVFLVDDDNILDTNCITELVESLEEDDRLGVVAPLMMRYPEEDIIWCAGGKLTKFGMPIHLLEGEKASEAELAPIIHGIDYFPNAYMVRSFIFREGIMHDTENFPHNWNEQDFCARVKRVGFCLATVTTAVTYHDVGYTTRITRIGLNRTFDQARARILYRRLYLNTPIQWLFFFLVLLPASTIYYMKMFAGQKDVSFRSLLAAYAKGTYRGLTHKL